MSDQFSKPPSPIRDENQIYSREKIVRAARTIDDLYVSISEPEDKRKLIADMEEWDKRIQGKYPDAYQCAMFHVIIGSTVSANMEINREDFPGEDSAEMLIGHLVEKYKKTKP